MIFQRYFIYNPYKCYLSNEISNAKGTLAGKQPGNGSIHAFLKLLCF